ncbi:MAG TPA: DinB family protein [Candidatus Acidoferrum sp.]|jgi:uncharacterized damage-inducible protein DinB|nr:DinB family protein [Candidatus Acidoferrum sp.]
MKRFCCLAFACAFLVAARAPRVSGQSMNGQAMGGSMSMSAAPSAFDYQAKFLTDMKDLQTKFVGLAQAIPQDKYTWRPGDGVRSISEVFLHVAGGNYGLTPMLGATPDPGYKRQGYETSTTDKAAIIDQLNKSFDYMDNYVQSQSAADLAKSHQLFGRPATGYDVLFTIVLDLHEHLGQQIAYARQNGVVPPWTAERQASQAARGRGMNGGAAPAAGATPKPQ